ncbi:pyroglutamyl-peptidase I [Miniphocaeibacter halophilus]|uniref:Pyroglutamyl-peptidase I n=1 Tax=Miniphocaeibacter halophilus TaxID=2931922 RepID=A0AC61MWR5_9FIRM|nr:pyroglutamyl-peptidase I [Miniphocaeibacter halophilus]QQK08804.1 pyroglutamyl-peptidase I [Miniphocaeibacter halophilus]
MKVLITGFDPFGGEEINPAFEAIKLLPNKIVDAEIIKLEVPTIFNDSIKVLEDAIRKNMPDIVICVGQAGGRFTISPERVAINLNDAVIPDNKGQQPVDEKIFKDGENAYFTSLPVKAMVKNMKKNHIPASISYSAGTYVCNNLMYGLLYLLNTIPEFKKIKGGFIHVPYSTEQILYKVNTPSLSLIQIAEGLEICIETAVRTKEDITTIGGTIH